MHFKFLALAAVSALSTGVQAGGVNASFHPSLASPLKPLSEDWSAEGQLVARQGGCDPDQEKCGELCCFSGKTCVNEEETICCDEGEEQCGKGCFDPATEICCKDEEGGTCTKSAPHCCGELCCFEGDHCEEGECVEGDHGPGSNGMLPAASIMTAFGGAWLAWLI